MSMSDMVATNRLRRYERHHRRGRHDNATLLQLPRFYTSKRRQTILLGDVPTPLHLENEFFSLNIVCFNLNNPTQNGLHASDVRWLPTTVTNYRTPTMLRPLFIHQGNLRLTTRYPPSIARMIP